jgi:hypothetical protein
LEGRSARRKASTYTTEQPKHRKNATIHALTGIRTHNLLVRASEDGSCLRLRGHCDRQPVCILSKLTMKMLFVLFAVLTTLIMQNTTFRDVMRCSLVLLTIFLTYFSHLKMEAVCFFQSSGKLYRTHGFTSYKITP